MNIKMSKSGCKMKKVLMPLLLGTSLLSARGEWYYGLNGLHDENGRSPSDAELAQITSVEIPEGFLSIVDGAFAGCRSLKTIKIPEGVLTIGEYAFDGCNSLETIELPEGLLVIAEGAFRGCSSLKTIKIPEGVKSIGAQAFENCSSLKYSVIPDSVKTIGDNAFRGCTSLKAIKISEKFYEGKDKDAENARMGIDSTQCTVNYRE